MPSRKHFSTSIKPSRTFYVECDVSSINRRRVPYHTRLKSNFDRLLYIIFFITQIHTVCLVSINGEASRVRPSKKKILKKSWKKIWRKIWKEDFGKKFWQKNYAKINYKTKIFITKIYSNIESGTLNGIVYYGRTKITVKFTKRLFSPRYYSQNRSAYCAGGRMYDSRLVRLETGR